MGGFEDYLKENRDKLVKTQIDDHGIWDKIEAEQERRKARRIRSLYGAVACLALLMASFSFVNSYMKQAPEVLPLSLYSSAYGEVEENFIRSVSYETELVTNEKVSAREQKVIQSYLKGVEELDIAYKGYCKVVERSGKCDDIIMELIIENYERRLELLRSLNIELKKDNSYEKNGENDPAENFI